MAASKGLSNLGCLESPCTSLSFIGVIILEEAPVLQHAIKSDIVHVRALSDTWCCPSRALCCSPSTDQEPLPLCRKEAGGQMEFWSLLSPGRAAAKSLGLVKEQA